MSGTLLETILLAAPILTMLGILGARSIRWVGRINTIGMAVLFVIGLEMSRFVLSRGPMQTWRDFVYIDALSCLMILLVTSVSFLSSFYSMGYMTNDLEEKIRTIGRLRGYYILFDLFVLTMLVVCTTNNLGVLWIAIEATTLASALLVGYYNKKSAVDAGWKYLMICGVGISFALVGVVLTYESAIHVVGHTEKGLDWSYLMSVAPLLHPAVLKLAFVFVLVGFGTKAGLAPMHTWLPDAHSEAPTPVSALLSGVLLKCSLYGVLRIMVLVNQSVDPAFSSRLLLFFGIVSIAIAAPSIMVQKNIKRLLAYSSIEHMGVMTVGISFGSPLGVYAALLHAFNHAMTKSLLFFLSGNLALKYRTKTMGRIHGAIRVMPVTGPLLLVGSLALSGAPPFSIFASEWLILTAGIQDGRWIPCGLLVLFFVIIFVGVVSHVSSMAFGVAPDLEAQGAGLPAGEINRFTVFPLWIPLFFIVVMGWTVPGPLHVLLLEATKVVSRGGPLWSSAGDVAGASSW